GILRLQRRVRGRFGQLVFAGRGEKRPMIESPPLKAVNKQMAQTKEGMSSKKKKLSPDQREELLRTLKARFEKNMTRHKGLEWAGVQARLESNSEKLWSLHEMEKTGGEPDVVGHNKKTGEYVFYDCSA